MEDCGINRNSFYYHYQDLPSMAEEIILEEAEAMVRQHPSVDSIEECIDLAVSFALETGALPYTFTRRTGICLNGICGGCANMWWTPISAPHSRNIR